MKFRNPTNGYIETASAPGFWCLLFGPLYFLSKGVFFHAIISFVVALMTFGFSWLIYPIFAGGAVRRAYLRNGWTEVYGRAEEPAMVRHEIRRTSHAT